MKPADSFKLPDLDREDAVLFGGNLEEPRRIQVRRFTDTVVVPVVWPDASLFGYPIFYAQRFHRRSGTNLFYCPDPPG